LLIATVLDPRIKDKLFSPGKQAEVRALLIKELESLNKSQSDVIDDSNLFEPPPKKITKLSTSGYRIQQLLDSKQKQYGIEDTVSSKIIAVNFLILIQL